MQLIKIEPGTIGNESRDTVNARELHAFLGVGKEFANWIKDRIEAFDFTENQDFVVIAGSGKNPSGGRPTKDYHLTLDMAKELSMVERNEKGKQARQYFIECERRAKNPIAMLRDPDVLLGLVEDYAREVKKLKPVADVAIRIANTENGTLGFRQLAKVLAVKEKWLREWLIKNRFCYCSRQKGPLIGYQDKVEAGYVTHRVAVVPGSDGEDKDVCHVQFTGKGVCRITALIQKEANQLLQQAA